MFISLFCCSFFSCVFFSSCVFVATINHIKTKQKKIQNILISDNPNAPGAPLGESLWKLPNRRFHPEYYFTVTKPISMAQIRNKLKKGDYTTRSQLANDLNLMLENAKKAFLPTHKVHRDALKMSKLLSQKTADDESDDEESDDSDDESTQSSTKRKPKPKVTSTSPATSSLNVSSNSINANTGNSPKCKFPNNPMLKKKLLNLQKFLSEYTVSVGIYHR